MGLLDPVVELTVVQCGTCGVVHSIPKTMRESLQAEGGYYWCPNGHQRGWSKGTLQSQLEQARKDLEAQKARTQAALDRANSVSQELGKTEIQLKRTKTILRKHKVRTANGVCPCCNRTFKQLAAHMKSQHPEYTRDQE